MIIIRHFFLYWVFPAICLFGLIFGVFQPFDRWLSDQRFQFSNIPLSGDIVLVDIDAKSIKALGGWPWKRSIHARILNRLRESGASDIAFDVDFSSPSSKIEDDLFAEALKNSDGETILANFAQFKTASKEELLINRPIDLFNEHSWPAVVNIFPDNDTRVRIAPLGMVLDGEPLLSIAALLGGYSGNVEEAFYIDYGLDASAFTRISVIDLLNNRVSVEQISDKKIIIGATALELNDFFSVPRYGIISGHTLQALAAETLLTNRSLSLSSPKLIAFFLVLFSILFLIMQTLKIHWGISIIAYGVVSLSLEIAATFLQGVYSFSLLTGTLHICLAGFIFLTIVRHIDLSRLLLIISERRADNTKKVLDQVIADNFDGIIILNEKGLIHTINSAACNIVQKISRLSEADFKSMDRLQGEVFSDIVDINFSSAIEENRSLISKKSEEMAEPKLFEYSSDQDERHIFEYLVSFTTLQDVRQLNSNEISDETFIYIHLRDITQKVLAEERLAYLAHFDPLTGLPNRNNFLTSISNKLIIENVRQRDESFKPFALVALSIKRFDLIQNSLGNAIADEIVLLLVDRLKSFLRAEEILAFQAFDRFLLILDAEQGVEALKSRLEYMLENLTMPYYYEGYGAVIGACAGLCFVTDHSKKADFLLKNVESASAMARKAGDGHITTFEPDMDVKIQTRQQLELDLWSAFEREELLVAHQPQVSLATGELYGAEALVRWQHPEKGFISPEIFINIAEQSGLIIELGDWVMQRACEEAANWPKALQLAVNLSPLQFIQGDLIGSVEKALSISKLEIARLDLEVTESLFIDDNERVSSLMQHLRAMGIRIALDDFGTGYASLGYLQSFQMDKIKIDQSFVRDIDINPQSASIVRCVGQLAKDLDLQVVAEGIETKEHYRLAKLSSCTFGQGYYFSKPLKNKDFIHFMEDGFVVDKLTAN